MQALWTDMKHSNVPARSRLVVAALGVALVAGACGTETIDTASLSDTGAAVERATTTTTATTIPTTTRLVEETGEQATSTTEPVAEPVAEPAAEDPAPTTEPPAPVEPAPCGEFGPLPAVPDSMPTKLYDTDGDGAADDAVTAYGAIDGWRVRVVQDEVVSEALVDQIAGWAYLGDPIPTASGDRIVLIDNDTDGTWKFTTDDLGCIRPYVKPPTQTIDDLVIVPIDPPKPVIDDFAAPEDDLMCGPLPAVPDDALIGSELWLDLDGGGADDDRIIAYFDGDWKLRGEFSFGAQSEIEIPGAGVHGVRVLGFADVDLTYGGEEIIAVVGGGAATVEIGVFSFLEGGCIFRYQHENGGDFEVLTGASVMMGDGIVCGDGYISSWGYQREDDDTYTVWGASYEPVALGVFGYMPASDDYAEGLSFDDISTDLFDCNGLTI